jgi:hypothetical protein
MEVFEHDGINIYMVDTKLQTADIGTKRTTCLDTRRPNCILINLSEPGVDAMQQRALLSSLRRDTVEKLHTRKESNNGRRLWNMLGRTQAPPAYVRGGLNTSPQRESESRPTR